MNMRSKVKLTCVKNINPPSQDDNSQSSYQMSNASQLTKKEEKLSERVIKFNFPHFTNSDSISFDYFSFISTCPLYQRKYRGNPNGLRFEKVIYKIKSDF